MIAVMQDQARTPDLDWLVISVRWMVLLTMALAPLPVEVRSSDFSTALLLAGLWVIFLTILAKSVRFSLLFRLVSVAGDLVIAYGGYFLSGGGQVGLAWVSILPIFTASVYFHFWGTFIVALLNTLVIGGLAWWTEPELDTLFFISGVIVFSLLSGLAVTLVVQKLIPGLLGFFERQEAQEAKNAADIESRRTLYRIISSLNASLNYQQVLDTALDASVAALGENDPMVGEMVGAVLVFADNEEGETILLVGSALKLTITDMRAVLTGTQGLIARAIQDQEPRYTPDVLNDSELSRFTAMHRCKAAYCVPLGTGREANGFLVYAHPDPAFFNAGRREILDMIGNQASIALQNARLYKDLAQEKERIMEIQEESRKKMARDLHDGPTQSVAAIAMRVNFARRLSERDPKAAAEELLKIEELSRKTTKEIRHMLFTLRPLVLESQGLIAALDSMAQKMQENYNQQVVIQADERLVDRLEINKQAVVFYIAEEAVNNARKHANAAYIWIRLKLIQEDLGLLEIEDDGKGFNVSEMEAGYENRSSLGMVNMRERTELINGVLHLESAPGKGTRVQVAIPLREDAAERLRRGRI